MDHASTSKHSLFGGFYGQFAIRHDFWGIAIRGDEQHASLPRSRFWQQQTRHPTIRPHVVTMLKRLIRSSFGNALVGWTIGSVIALLMITIRWRVVDKEQVNNSWPNRTGLSWCFGMNGSCRCRGFGRPGTAYTLQSPHADGQMMSHAIGCFGVKTVWGSSNRNPLSGLRGLKRV